MYLRPHLMPNKHVWGAIVTIRNEIWKCYCKKMAIFHSADTLYFPNIFSKFDSPFAVACAAQVMLP